MTRDDLPPAARTALPLALAIGAAAVGGVALARALERRDRDGDGRTADDAPFRSAKSGPQPGLLSGEAVVGHTVTIGKPRQEIYAFWRDWRNLPRIMDNLQSITNEGDQLDWTIKAPGGTTVELKTRVTEDKPGEIIAWASTEDSAIQNEGKVTFRDAPAGRGTIVTLTMKYAPPGGRVGQVVAKALRREPAIQAKHDLKRLRMLLETGEIADSAPNRTEAKEGQA